MNMWMNTTNEQPPKSKYPITEFTCYDESDEVYKQKKRAYRISDWILVSYCGSGYKIYRMDGKPAIKTVFDAEELELAKMVAQMLQDVYGDFFSIWKEYPEANVFELAQWTVENGVDLCKVIKEAKTGKDFQKGI